MSLPTFTKVGRISKDIELRYSNDGKEIAKSSIVFSEKYGEKENTCFIDFVCFGNTAKTLNAYFNKGDRVEGNFKLVQENWTAQDGSNRSKHSLVLEKIGEFIEKKDNQGQQSSRNEEHDYRGNGYNENAPKVERRIPEIDIDEDEIPF